jgi:serine phosphatase RsbU (regulator of sigma subunit)
MASLGNAFLQEIVTEHHVIEPHQILSVLDQKIAQTMNRRGGGAQMTDGMDATVVVIDAGTFEMRFAGAKHSLYWLREGALQVIKGSPFSIGGKDEPQSVKRFQKETRQLAPGDRLYLCSDGFQDQFGGPENRKYMRARLKQFFVSLAGLPMNEQNEAFAAELEQWKGAAAQTDDILVMGLEI